MKLKDSPGVVRCRIRGPEAAQLLSENGLLTLLSSLLPVSFFSNRQDGAEAAGEISWQRPEDQANGPWPGTLPRLSVPLPAATAASSGQYSDAQVDFADSPEIPMPFRGRRVTARMPVEPRGLALGENETALATSRQRPIWAMSETRGIKAFRSSLPLPELKADEGFDDVFNGERFVEMLPLLHFLQSLDPAGQWQDAPLRACFIIDDPNLHSTRYGFADYRAMIEDAKRWNYHVSFATIPLDTWFTQATAADIFRENPGRVSLVIHGNNHAREELAQNYTAAARGALLRQAIRRIARLERESGLRVGRVMVPPHGACSRDMLEALPRYGFESACVSTGSLRGYNPGQLWTRPLGFHPAEVVADCPVLQRWGLDGRVENKLLVAAYLGQALILRGHHQDLRHGLEVLGHFADFINGLGTVRWADVPTLSRLSYQWRMEGNVCWVRPFANLLDVEIPDGARGLAIERSGAGRHPDWRAVPADRPAKDLSADQPVSLPDGSTQNLRLERRFITLEQPADETLRWTPPTLIVRRALTEVRDRLLM